MTRPESLGWTAWALGLAGLAPQAAALGVTAWGGADWSAYGVDAAFGYAAVILSFLGGIWWGFGMRRATGRGPLLGVSVLPSLLATFDHLAMFLAGKAGVPIERYYAWGLGALGLAILATLPVDAWLERSGDAPSGWTRFRTVLSLGLGLLTIAAGWAFAANTVTQTWV